MTTPTVEEQPKEKGWLRKRMKKEKKEREERGILYRVEVS